MFSIGMDLNSYHRFFAILVIILAIIILSAAIGQNKLEESYLKPTSMDPEFNIEVLLDTRPKSPKASLLKNVSQIETLGDNNIALYKLVSIATNGAEDSYNCSGDTPQDITDGSIEYKPVSQCEEDGCFGIVNDDYDQMLELAVTIDLQAEYRISTIRYNQGNCQRAETWHADLMISPFGTTSCSAGSSGQGTWTEQTGEIVASSITVFFKKTRISWATDWLFIGELEIYGSPVTEVFHEFTFAHMTDIHLGWETTELEQGSSNISAPPYFRTVTAYELFTDALQDIIDQNYNPDFILITGDIVENAKDNEDFFNQYKLALAHFEKNLGHEIQYYTVPGNHDRYEKSPGMEWAVFPGNDHLNQYYISIGRPDIGNDATIFPGFEKYSSPTNSSDFGLDWYNYSFEHNGYLFIGLDSGSDHHPLDPKPEGKGFHDDQITALYSFEQANPKICFMHHPIYTGASDPDYLGENESIFNNRDSFITYCQDNNVRLVIGGHTHRDAEKVNAGTIYIQTPSAAKNNGEYPRGYRIIKVENKSTVTPLPYRQTPVKKKYVEYAAGPVYLYATDSQGRYTGFGSIIVDIPGSYYTGYSNPLLPQIIILHNLNDDYKFNVAGADTGSADIGLVGKDLAIQIHNLPVTTTTIDKMHFQKDSTFVYTTNDQKKKFAISLAQEHKDYSREFIISNSSISNVDSAKFQILNDQSLKYTNIGSPKAYDLRLVQVGVDSGEFEYINISIGENEAQHITPKEWQNLNSCSINLEIDRGNDGTVDSSIVLSNATSVKHETIQQAAQGIELFRAYPNPFNSSTRIDYGLTAPGSINIAVYDILGRKVKLLIDEKKPSGTYSLSWNGCYNDGRSVASGVYLLKVRTENSLQIIKVTVMK